LPEKLVVVPLVISERRATVPVASGKVNTLAVVVGVQVNVPVTPALCITNWLVLPDKSNVGYTTVPVNVGDAKLDFKFKAVCVAVDTGLFASLVLSTLPKPTIVLSIPLTVPVKVG